MAKTKENPNFSDLLKQYKAFCERKAANMSESLAALSKSESDLASIQRRLSTEANTMSAEEYTELKKREKDLLTSVNFLEERIELMRSTPATTEEERRSFVEEISKLDTALAEELKQVTYKALKEIAKKYEPIITDLEKIRAMKSGFDKALGDGKSNMTAPRRLPSYSVSMIHMLLQYFNSFDEELGNGENTTTGYNTEELTEVREELKRLNMSAGVDGGGVVGISVPTDQDAYQAIYYNKPWVM